MTIATIDGADPGTSNTGQTPAAAVEAPPAEKPTKLAAALAGLELLQVDPAELVIGVNVRLDPQLDRAFIGSIRDHGVRVPICARRDADGRLVVRLGQRRTLAAVQAGRRLVPVVVEPDDPDDQTAAQIARIVDQLGENQHRSNLSEAEEVAAHQQLLDLGLSAGQIARRTRTPVKRVKATLAVAAAEVAREAMASGGLTVDRAAVVAEFADDPDAVQTLTTVAGRSPDQFDHIAQQLRDDRIEARLRAEATEQLTAAGVTVVDPPEVLFGGKIKRLSELRATPDTTSGTELIVEEHTSCEGHVAWLESRGWRPASERIVAVYGCADWRKHGHAELYAPAGAASSGRASGPMTEQEKAERREVIACNKAWDSAQRVRRTWLRQFLARKTPPPGAVHWIGMVLADGSHDLRGGMESGHFLAGELLGLTPDGEARMTWRSQGPQRLRDAVATASSGRATMLILAMLLSAFEDATSRNTWRSPTHYAQTYFAALQQWGYALSEVEQRVLPTENQADNRSTPPDAGADASGPTADPAAADVEAGGPSNADGRCEASRDAEPDAVDGVRDARSDAPADLVA